MELIKIFSITIIVLRRKDYHFYSNKKEQQESFYVDTAMSLFANTTLHVFYLSV